MSVTIYVEGGGVRAELKAKCREGFSKLFAEAGFAGRMPRVVACGARKAAFDRFQNALPSINDYPILLVDSEDRVRNTNQPDSDSSGAWRHLDEHDGWVRPDSADEEQAHLMVTSMETWLLADRQTLAAYFPTMNIRALLPDAELESRSRQDVLSTLKQATRPSNKGEYSKGRDSFTLLGQANPDALKNRLPHFRRLLETLEAHLSPG